MLGSSSKCSGQQTSVIKFSVLWLHAPFNNMTSNPRWLPTSRQQSRRNTTLWSRLCPVNVNNRSFQERRLQMSNPPERLPWHWSCDDKSLELDDRETITDAFVQKFKGSRGEFKGNTAASVEGHRCDSDDREAVIGQTNVINRKLKSLIYVSLFTNYFCNWVLTVTAALDVQTLRTHCTFMTLNNHLKRKTMSNDDFQ